MKVYAPATVTVSGINATGWDADLVCPAARRITFDHAGETTGGHGSLFDNALNLGAAGTLGTPLKKLVMVFGRG